VKRVLVLDGGQGYRYGGLEVADWLCERGNGRWDGEGERAEDEEGCCNGACLENDVPFVDPFPPSEDAAVARREGGMYFPSPALTFSDPTGPDDLAPGPEESRGASLEVFPEEGRREQSWAR
jgi:hypothetical protein